MPPDAAYRKYTEEIINKRLDIVKSVSIICRKFVHLFFIFWSLLFILILHYFLLYHKFYCCFSLGQQCNGRIWSSGLRSSSYDLFLWCYGDVHVDKIVRWRQEMTSLARYSILYSITTVRCQLDHLVSVDYLSRSITTVLYYYTRNKYITYTYTNKCIALNKLNSTIWKNRHSWNTIHLLYNEENYG